MQHFQVLKFAGVKINSYLCIRIKENNVSLLKLEIMAKLRKCGCYVETNEKVTFTFSGWDGKSYHGEPCTKKVWKNCTSNDEDAKYVVTYYPRHKVWVFHKIDGEHLHKESNLPTCYVVGDFPKDYMEVQTA